MLIAQGWKTGLLVQLPGEFIVARAPTPSHGRIKKPFMREQRRGHLPRATIGSRSANVNQQRFSAPVSKCASPMVPLKGGTFRRTFGSEMMPSQGRESLENLTNSTKPTLRSCAAVTRSASNPTTSARTRHDSQESDMTGKLRQLLLDLSGLTRRPRISSMPSFGILLYLHNFFFIC